MNIKERKRRRGYEEARDGGPYFVQMSLLASDRRSCHFYVISLGVYLCFEMIWEKQEEPSVHAV